jgi:DNA-binding IclR family transcriptional regulator
MAFMQVSRKVDYALRAVIHLANAEAQGRTCTVAEIAERERMPRQFLEKIVQQLIRKGLVRSRRGPHGGYGLARAAEGSPSETSSRRWRDRFRSTSVSAITPTASSWAPAA